jgi:hypothetical protein
MEFQPSADMSWQSWACNELNQAAKGNMSTMGGSIGPDKCNLWQPYTNSVRDQHLQRISDCLVDLPPNLNVATRRKKQLAFMAENGLRQMGPPRIGIFADRMRPDPLHCEINAWQQPLDVIYSESVQRGTFDNFIDILSWAREQ